MNMQLLDLLFAGGCLTGVLLVMLVLKGVFPIDLAPSTSPSHRKRKPQSPRRVRSRPRVKEITLDGKRVKVVERKEIPYWQERGWKPSDDLFEGYFRTRYGSWRGKAEVSPAGNVKMYICEPPKQLKEHDHWVCFNKRPKGWYFIHTVGRLKDVSAGIMQVEQILNEAFKL